MQTVTTFFNKEAIVLVFVWSKPQRYFAGLARGGGGGLGGGVLKTTSFVPDGLPI
jgi:hypothetical protein